MHRRLNWRVNWRRTARRHTAASSAGLTLVELAVAVLVLSIASLAALRAADQSRIAAGGEAPRLLARIAARNRAEELQLYGTARPLPEQVTQGGRSITLETAAKPSAGGLLQATVTARTGSGEGAQLVLYLAPGRAR
ncbi:type IV pilus modification PilV family protein [Leisingera sp. McT4-56]|uniref:type IV pilus modification PilV family protein n=1 Tax=Leisingera sp. McT4-56 TaxID=2881255 RepID=UPI001CF887BE|nr:hypothetical protein [Leisingera sp. McT4-56]MCB4457272.1 hypothetical protein [Leisingera sp. McT4-56]